MRLALSGQNSLSVTVTFRDSVTVKCQLFRFALLHNPHPTTLNCTIKFQRKNSRWMTYWQHFTIYIKVNKKYRTGSSELNPQNDKMPRLYPQHANSSLYSDAIKLLDRILSKTPLSEARNSNTAQSAPPDGSLLRLGVLMPELGLLFLFLSNPSIFARLGQSSSSANATNFTN